METIEISYFLPLYKKLLERVKVMPVGGGGICAEMRSLNENGEITFMEHAMLSNHFYKQKPHMFSLFWWNPSYKGRGFWWKGTVEGNKQRVKFIESIIKKLS